MIFSGCQSKRGIWSENKIIERGKSRSDWLLRSPIWKFDFRDYAKFFVKIALSKKSDYILPEK